MELAKNSKGSNIDRISALPDCVLHLIMSFLTAKEAVQTCVLSKGWKCLWTTLPFLDFRWYNRWADAEWFINFVNSTLFLREPTDVQTFRLSCKYMLKRHSNCMSIRSWILYVLKHNPKVFDIEISSEVELPSAVFTCSSLEDVSLSMGLREPSIGVIKLPHLKRLYLQLIRVNQDFVDKLFSGCGVLESLHLDQCGLEFSTITSQSLKYLHFQIGTHVQMVRKTLGLINAPNLLSFYYGDCPSYIGHTTLLYTPYLTDAIICITCLCGHVYNGKKLFAGISNIQNLKLTGRKIKEILENELPQCPVFPNLKDLFVDKLCLNCHFNVLASFINHFPNLEKLSLVHQSCMCEVREGHGTQELLKISPFQGKQLITVKVQIFDYDKNFPRVMNYLQESVLKSRARICVSNFSMNKCPSAAMCYCHSCYFP